MRMEYLYYFEKVYDEKSITKASEKLFVSQPALSIAISNMEKELGVKLFERKRGGVIATEYGEKIIHPVREIIRNIELIHQSVVQEDNQELRIISLVIASYVVLPNVLSYVVDHYSDVNISVEETIHLDSLDVYLEKSASADFFGICSIDHDKKDMIIEKLSKRKIKAEFLASDRSYCFAGTALFPGKNAIDGKDCFQNTMIEFSPIQQKTAQVSNVSPYWADLRCNTHHIIVNNIEMMKQAICDNLGFALMPGLTLYGDHRLLNGTIRRLRLQNIKEDGRLEYYLLYPDRPLENFEEAFVQSVIEEFSNFALGA